MVGRTHRLDDGGPEFRFVAADPTGVGGHDMAFDGGTELAVHRPIAVPKGLHPGGRTGQILSMRRIRENADGTNQSPVPCRSSRVGISRPSAGNCPSIEAEMSMVAVATTRPCVP